MDNELGIEEDFIRWEAELTLPNIWQFYITDNPVEEPPF